LGDTDAKRERDSFTVPLLGRHGEAVVPSFILMAMIKEAGAALEAVEVSLDSRMIKIGGGEKSLDIPIDTGGRLRVHTGIRQAISKYNADILFLVGAEDIRDQLTEAQKSALLSRIVILGTDDEIARTIDLPKGEGKISQAELFAMAIATIQAERFIQKVPAFVEYGIWAGLLGLGLLMLRLRRKRRVVMWWGVLLILYFVGNLILFQYTEQWTPLVVPLGIIASILLVALVLPASRPKAEEDGAAPAEAGA
ncbi:MAG: hypothetical protein ACR2RV_15625, partial [Verrucomicrobiales bacterium]